VRPAIYLAIDRSSVINELIVYGCDRCAEVRCISDKDDYVSDRLCVSQRGPSPSLTQPCHVTARSRTQHHTVTPRSFAEPHTAVPRHSEIPHPASHSHSEVLRRASHSRATWPVTSRSASSPTGRNGRPAVVAVVATACDTAPWKVSRTLSAAVADGPARRAASRASCCTQRWMRSV